MTKAEIEAKESNESWSANYLTKWDPFDYLRNYWATATTTESPNNIFVLNIVKLLKEHSDTLKRRKRVLDFGAGPTLWPSFLLAQYFDEIWYSDYTPSNLQCTTDWLDEKPAIYDWQPFFKYLLTLKQGYDYNVEECETRLRAALRKGKICRCDVNSKELLLLDDADNDIKFDMILSIGCLESSCTSHDKFKQTIRCLGERLEVGGMLLLLSYRNDTHYICNGHMFKTLPFDEVFIQQAYSEAGIFTKPVVTVSFHRAVSNLEQLDGVIISYAYRKTNPMQNQDVIQSKNCGQPVVVSTKGETDMQFWKA